MGMTQHILVSLAVTATIAAPCGRPATASAATREQFRCIAGGAENAARPDLRDAWQRWLREDPTLATKHRRLALQRSLARSVAGGHQKNQRRRSGRACGDRRDRFCGARGAPIG